MTTSTVRPVDGQATGQRSIRAAGWVVDLAIIVTGATVAGLLDQDANWDQLQYHYWYPWQLFNGGFTDPDLYGGRFQNPLPQVPFFLLATYLPPLWAQATLGAVAGLVAVLARRIAARVLPFSGGWLLAASTATAALAMVGAGFRSEWGTSHSDVLLTGLLLGGLLLVLRERPVSAGLLAGAAVGLKYTAAPFVLATLLALLVLQGPRWPRVWRWSLAAVGGFALTGAVWALQLQRTYDSPVFPFWNGLFGSPWFPAENLTDPRFGVDGLTGWLSWPWDIASGSARVLDLPVADPRWLLMVGAIAGIAAAGRRVSRTGLAVVIFTVAGTLIWLAVFGVLRYAIPAEMTAAIVLVYAVSLYADSRLTFVAALVLAVLAGLLTESGNARRVPFSRQWFEVDPAGFERVTPGDAVLVDGQYPSSFLVAGTLPPEVAVHVVQKDYTDTPLLGWLKEDLAAAGQVWVVTGGEQSQVDGVVGTIDYRRCTRIESNVTNRRLCPVRL